MRILINLFLFLFVGCVGRTHEHKINLCPVADFISGGVCVVTNGYDIDPGLIEFAVETTNVSVDEMRPDRSFYLNDDFPTIFADIGVSLEYVPENHSSLLLDKKYARGLNRGTGIVVNYLEDTTPVRRCIESYYVFAHELLHIVSKRIIGVNSGQNSAHAVPGIFITDAELSSAELLMYFDIKDKCNDLYKQPED